MVGGEDDGMSNATFLTDGQMRLLAQAGHAVVEPFDEAFLQSASIDLRLGDIQYKYKFDSYALGQDITPDDYEHVKFEEIILEPRESAFIGLAETIHVPANCVGFVFPRSSITRIGLSIPPVYINPGYNGQMPITIVNNTAIKVKISPRVRVAQLLCARLSVDARLPYDLSPSSKYIDEVIAPSRLHSDEEIRAALEQVLRQTVPGRFLEHLKI